MKVVISDCYGGFGFSQEARRMLAELGVDADRSYAIDRDDPRVFQVIEALGARSAGHMYAHLVIVEIPDDVEWHIHEYDGYETVHEDHRIWTSDGEERNCGG